MDEHQRIFKALIINVLYFFLIILLSVGCKKEDDSEFVNSERYFMLDITKNRYQDVLYVGFSTELGSQVPYVELNGELINRFYLYKNMGDITIPNKEEISYSVKANGLSTTGSIQMPKLPNMLKCNGVVLNSSTRINPAKNYVFTWEKTSNDYSSVQLASIYKLISHAVLNGDATEFIVDSSGITGPILIFNFYVINGVKFTHGAIPNVFGEYGKGYVSASEYIEYNIELNSN